MLQNTIQIKLSLQILPAETFLY